MGNANLMLRVALLWTSVPWGGGGRIEILLVASRFRNQDKCRPDGWIGSHADLTFLDWASNCSVAFPVRYYINTIMHATNGTKFQSVVSICASLVILLLGLFSLNINQLLCMKVENVIRIQSKLIKKARVGTHVTVWSAGKKRWPHGNRV